MKETRTQSWLPSNHCPSRRKAPTCFLLTVTPQTHTHTHTNSLLNMHHWQTGVKGHVRTVSKHMRTGRSWYTTATVRAPRGQLQALAVFTPTEKALVTYWTGMWDSTTAILKLLWALHHTAMAHEYLQSRGATSKVWVPEGWYKASSIPRTHNSGVPYEPHCHP